MRNARGAPSSISRILHSAGRGSVGNAARAAAQLAKDNAERAILRLAPEVDPHEPGSLARLSRRESMDLLRTRSIGRFAHVDHGRVPSVVPVNYVVTRDGRLLFCTGPGPKLASASQGELVAFEVDDLDEKTRTGWSVLVTGDARRVPSREHAAIKQMPVPWAAGPRTYLVEITPRHIEGRVLH